MDIKPIETVYNGYRFRSRLEARYAVYFDTLGIKYEYEKEGYDLGELGWYLPDFWLPQVEKFAEVKPDTFSALEVTKMKALCILTGKNNIMLDGLPSARNYWGFEYRGECFECNDDFEPTDKILPPNAYLWDYLLHEGSRYWENEGRFYVSTGEPEGYIINLYSYGHPIDCICKGCDYFGAIAASRSARFEYGEHGGK